MSDKLTIAIARIRAACEKALELDGKATPMPWVCQDTLKDEERGIGPEDNPVVILTALSVNDDMENYFTETDTANGELIAFYRNFTPGAARAWLMMIEGGIGAPIFDYPQYATALIAFAESLPEVPR